MNNDTSTWLVMFPSGHISLVLAEDEDQLKALVQQDAPDEDYKFAPCSLHAPLVISLSPAWKVLETEMGQAEKGDSLNADNFVACAMAVDLELDYEWTMNGGLELAGTVHGMLPNVDAKISEVCAEVEDRNLCRPRPVTKLDQPLPGKPPKTVLEMAEALAAQGPVSDDDIREWVQANTMPTGRQAVVADAVERLKAAFDKDWAEAPGWATSSETFDWE